MRLDDARAGQYQRPPARSRPRALGHDVVRLADAVREAALELPNEIESRLRRLGRHHIPARYPDAHPSGPPGAHYGASDADEAIADAEAVLAFADELWEGLRE